MPTHTPPPTLTPEQVLIIADIFCEEHKLTVSNFGALYAIAAITQAAFQGVRVFESATQVAAAIEHTTRLLKPLSSKNSDFAQAVAAVYKAYAATAIEVAE
ncbi:MAG: TetR family transcriptional regulator [Corynebacterium sp.]|uniref:TetR family transcriptional regulator n=1 Tax=Corynebacterium sp. TaxID=1720 RepID=UPI0026DC1A11|nr:TetR family transcriptional regulator [Corynebacterium sp.]MDO5098607.1 TetR family transcriptional regulator [Corynebacterium sp.]